MFGTQQLRAPKANINYHGFYNGPSQPFEKKFQGPMWNEPHGVGQVTTFADPQENLWQVKTTNPLERPELIQMAQIQQPAVPPTTLVQTPGQQAVTNTALNAGFPSGTYGVQPSPPMAAPVLTPGVPNSKGREEPATRSTTGFTLPSSVTQASSALSPGPSSYGSTYPSGNSQLAASLAVPTVSQSAPSVAASSSMSGFTMPSPLTSSSSAPAGSQQYSLATPSSLSGAPQYSLATPSSLSGASSGGPSFIPLPPAGWVPLAAPPTSGAPSTLTMIR